MGLITLTRLDSSIGRLISRVMISPVGSTVFTGDAIGNELETENMSNED